MSPVIHASQIEHVRLSDLTPYDSNARLHSEEQISQLMATIKEDGFTSPLLIDEQNVIIAGHGRKVAAERLGMPTVPCIRVTGLSDQQLRALRLRDNKIALNSSWDEQILREEVAALLAADIDLIGFETVELEALFEGTEFAPELQPVFAGRQVNASDVAQAAGRMLQLGEERARKALISVMCPHCAQQFQIDDPGALREPRVRSQPASDAHPRKGRRRAGAA